MVLVLPLFLVQAASIWIFYDRHYQIVTKRLASALAGDIAIAIALRKESQTEDQVAKIFKLAQHVTGISFSFHQGQKLTNGRWKPSWSVPEQRLDKALRSKFDKSVGGPFAFEVDVHGLADQVKVQVQLPDGVLLALAPSRRLFTSTIYFVILWMAGASTLFLGIAAIFMRNQLKPIQRLAKAAEAFGKGRALKDFKPEGAHEVRLASTSFLRMSSRIKRQVENHTAMLAGVSHDLRTPLTRVRLQLALMPQDSAIAELRADVSEMEAMIEGYLSFVRGGRGEETSSVKICDLLREITIPFFRSDQDFSITLAVEEGSKTLLLLRCNAIKRALTNIVTNAVRHSTALNITTILREKSLEILFDDNGQGIPEAYREDVLKPFFRLESSRSRATGGQGLGLSIAADIIGNHGGEIKLEDSPQGGLRVRVLLPL